MLGNNIYYSVQSAYVERHSTKTALLKVQSDILTALDSGSGAALLMLDLSSAFDIIDHAILLSILNSFYGISENALHWFKSYLSSRVQRVIIDGTLSECKDLNFGVPRGLYWDRRFIVYCFFVVVDFYMLINHLLKKKLYVY